MKKLLLLVLIVAVCAAAYFAKPQDPKASFEAYLTARANSGDSLLPAALNEFAIDRFADSCEFNSHLLWVDVKFHDKTIYTNVFSHWINRAEFKKSMQDDLEKGKDKMDKAVDHIAGK